MSSSSGQGQYAEEEACLPRLPRAPGTIDLSSSDEEDMEQMVKSLRADNFRLETELGHYRNSVTNQKEKVKELKRAQREKDNECQAKLQELRKLANETKMKHVSAAKAAQVYKSKNVELTRQVHDQGVKIEKLERDKIALQIALDAAERPDQSEVGVQTEPEPKTNGNIGGVESEPVVEAMIGNSDQEPNDMLVDVEVDERLPRHKEYCHYCGKGYVYLKWLNRHTQKCSRIGASKRARNCPEGSAIKAPPKSCINF